MGTQYELKSTRLVRPPPTLRQEKLTPRQLEVLAMLCEGLPNKLIARRLDMAGGDCQGSHCAHSACAERIQPLAGRDYGAQSCAVGRARQCAGYAAGDGYCDENGCCCASSAACQ